MVRRASLWGMELGQSVVDVVETPSGQATVTAIVLMCCMSPWFLSLGEGIEAGRADSGVVCRPAGVPSI